VATACPPAGPSCSTWSPRCPGSAPSRPHSSHSSSASPSSSSARAERHRELAELVSCCRRTSAPSQPHEAPPEPPPPRHSLRGATRTPTRPHFSVRRRGDLAGAPPRERSPWSRVSIAPPCMCSCATESPGRRAARKPLTGDHRASYRRRAATRSPPPAAHAGKPPRWSRAPLQLTPRLAWVGRARWCPHRRPRTRRRRVTAGNHPPLLLSP
jgi:hypothetical protein